MGICCSALAREMLGLMFRIVELPGLPPTYQATVDAVEDTASTATITMTLRKPSKLAKEVSEVGWKLTTRPKKMPSALESAIR